MCNFAALLFVRKDWRSMNSHDLVMDLTLNKATIDFLIKFYARHCNMWDFSASVTLWSHLDQGYELHEPFSIRLTQTISDDIEFQIIRN